MKIKIRNIYTNKVLIKGKAEDLKSFLSNLPPNADLREADLREADLCGANLRKANLFRVNLRGADLYGAKINAIQKEEILTALNIKWEE